MSGPLEGIRVVELAMWVAGPAVGGILADWGADVIKVEPPRTGDPMRFFHRQFDPNAALNPPFELDNRNKRSLAVDLRDGDGHAAVLDLIAQSDVFVSNLRLGALERLGLDHETLLARHPRLIYAALTGYGMSGDDRDRAAYDVGVWWSRSGIAASLTQDGQPPPFQRGGMGDHTTAMSIAGGVSAALFARERTGRGQLVSASLYRQGAYTIGWDTNTMVRTGQPIGRSPRTQFGSPTINCYPCADGLWIWLIGLEAERHWPTVARALGHPEWIDDEQFGTTMGRAMNGAALIAQMDAEFRTRTRAEWAPILDAHDVWWAPVQSVEDVMVDPQAWAAGLFVEIPETPNGTSASLSLNTPVDFGDTTIEHRWLPVELGHHTDEIMRELGHDDATIEAMRARGALG